MSKEIITLGKWNDKLIEWIVVDEIDNKELVICKELLFDTMKYNNSSSSSDWKSCSVREFLNKEFFFKAFSKLEQQRIINTELANEKTKDDVFILTLDDAKSYIKGCEWADRYCFTRTIYDSYRIKIFNYLRKTESGEHVSYRYDVRPAMWIKKA